MGKRKKKNSGGKLGNLIGKTSEKIVETALEEMKRCGEISDFKKQDLPGSDFFVNTTDGRTIRIDSKSGYLAAYNHYLKYDNSFAVVVKHNGRKLKKHQMRGFVEKVKKDIRKILKF